MPAAVSIDSDLWACWNAGELSWLLHDDQLDVYQRYRKWERRPTHIDGGFSRLFVLDIGRRWGKTTWVFVVKLEDCIRNARSAHRYATAFQKDIEEILDDVSRYVLETCPDDLRPEYRLAHGARPAGWYFPNGSVLKTVGLDKNPEGLRGRSSDGEAISEAAFVRHLRHNVKNVLYPQFQQRAGARIILESSAPEEPDTEYDTLFVEDARRRGAYVFRTIDDNPLLSDHERNEFVTAAGGRGHPDCEREYYNARLRPADRMLVPEFREKEQLAEDGTVLPSHVRESEPPQYRDCYTSLDPGVSHLAALIHGYWDFARGKLVIERDWAKRNANTEVVKEAIAEAERELWTGVESWRVGRLQPAPALRVSDTDLRLIIDLQQLHGLVFTKARKDDADAALNALRVAFRRDQIEIHPRCEVLISHLRAGVWNTARTNWATHEHYGHFDAIAALVYLWRMVDKTRNPEPPATHGLDHTQYTVLHEETRSRAAKALNQAFGGRNARRKRK